MQSDCSMNWTNSIGRKESNYSSETGSAEAKAQRSISRSIKATKKFAPYINFLDVFPKFVSDTGNTAGIVSIAFDPGYAKNGKFYTVHVEKPDIEGSANPTNAKLSTLKVEGYSTTPVVRPPAGSEVDPISWTKFRRFLDGAAG